MIKLSDKPLVDSINEDASIVITQPENIDGETKISVKRIKPKKLTQGLADVLTLQSEKKTPLVLSDTKEATVIDYQIYGNSTQDGTPTPNNPVEVVSVGTFITDETSEHYGKYEIPITVYGKNLIKLRKGTEPFKPGHQVNDDGSVTVNAGEGGNTATSNLAITAISYVVQKDGEILTVSCKGATNIVKGQVGYKSVTASSTQFRNITSSTASITFPNAEFPEVKAGDKFTMVVQVGANVNVPQTVTLYPQLEIGYKATKYEKYVEPITYNIYLDEPLRKIKATYSGEADIYDYIDFKKGVVVRNIAEGSVPTTGGNFDWNNGNGRRFTFSLSKKKYGSSITTIGYFNLGTVMQNVSGGVNSNTLQAYLGTNGLYWYLDFSVCGLDGTEEKAVAEAAFRNWLKTVDTTFTYVLKTPTETKVNFPEIIANYPTTTILCGSEIQVVYEADTTNAFNKLTSELDIIKRAIIELGGMD